MADFPLLATSLSNAPAHLPLQVSPTAKEVKLVGSGGVVTTRLRAHIITFMFDGNWMPIPGAAGPRAMLAHSTIRSPGVRAAQARPPHSQLCRAQGFLCICPADVSVDVVGKYAYELRSPSGDLRTPLIVDVVLTGRTKLLKVSYDVMSSDLNIASIYMGWSVRV